MEYDHFIARVQEEADMADWDAATEGVTAVLATLGERLYRTEASHLAAQLPRELKGAIRAVRPPAPSRTAVESFSLEEFYARVSKRADVGYPQAVQLTRGVAAVLKEAVSPGELEDIRSELSADYAELFD